MWAAAHDEAGDLPSSDLVRQRLVAARTDLPPDFQNQDGMGSDGIAKRVLLVVARC